MNEGFGDRDVQILIIMATEQWKKENADKMREYRRRHYRNNKDVYLKRAKDGKQQLREWYQELKSQLACPCGENHPACLQFHHRDPKKKDFNLAMAASRGYSKKKIEEEISKCDVLCSNCHLKLHYDIRQDNIN